MDATATIAPREVASASWAALARSHVARVFTANMRSQSSTAYCASGPGRFTPALLTTPSSPPKCAIASSTTRPGASAVAMSPGSGSIAAPRSPSSFPSASSAGEGPRSTAAICALRPAALASRARRRQVARPIPLAAPVTSARTGSGSRERLALGGETIQQGRGLPVLALRLPPLLHPVAHGLEPDLIGPEHRAAPVDWPAVAVDPDHVDVARPDRDLLLQDLGPLVDHRVEQPRQDLVLPDLPPGDAHLARYLDDDLLHVGVGDRGAVALLVAEVTRAGLLAEAAQLADAIRHRRLHALALADAPAHVEAGEVAHREGAHREAEVGEDLVHLVGQGALEDQLLGLAPALVQHAVAHEAVADADQHRHLGDAAAHAHRGGDHILGRLLTAHDLEQPHHVGGAEEVHADHAVRPLGGGGDLVHVQRGGVGGEHCPRLADLVDLREDFLLDRHLLEDSLDHDVGVGDLAPVGGAGDQPHALLDVLHGEPAAGRGRLVVLPHHAEAAVERVLGHLDDRHRDARVGEVHRDATAHGAGPEHRRLLDLPALGVAGHVGDLGRLALCEEEVALGL